MDNERPWYVRTKADELALEQGCYYCPKQAEKIITFCMAYIKPFYLQTDQWELYDWQKKLLRYVMGWRTASGERRFRKLTIFCAKKGGKTLLMSILGGFDLYASGQKSPFTCITSTSEQNATQVFRQLSYDATRNEELKERSAIFKAKHNRRIENKANNGELRVFTSEATTVEGENLSLVLMDEQHAARSDKQFNALEHATTQRRGLFVVVSTAGEDKSHWFHQKVYLPAKAIIEGRSLDISTAAFLWEADPESDFENDVSQWYAANPSLNLEGGVSEEQFREELQTAKATDMTAWLNFQRYRLNLWVSSHTKLWVQGNKLLDHEAHYEDNFLRQYESVIGVDLSTTTDPSSIGITWALPGGIYYTQSWAFVCREGYKRREAANEGKYKAFVDEGSMTITEGNMIDDDLIVDEIEKLYTKYESKMVVMDVNSAFCVAKRLTSRSMETYVMRPTRNEFTAPMRQYEKAFNEGRIQSDGTTWLVWCLNNVRLDVSKDGGCRIDKERSVDKVDGAFVSVMSFGVVFVEGQPDEPCAGVIYI